MGNRRFSALVLILAIVGLGILACDTGAVLNQIGLGTTAKPTVTIQSPAAGAQFREGDDVTVTSTARDPGGIVRVELAVDGATVRTDAPPVPQGQVVFTLVQTWKAVQGNHTLTVRAFNASGAASEPAVLSVVVTSVAAPAPTGTATLVLGPSATPLGQGTQLAITPQVTATSATGTSAAQTPKPTTRPSPTRTRTPTVVSGPPGVYALSIRVDPPSPYRKTNVGFFVTFLNTTGAPQDYRWRINIYRPDNMNKPMGDTMVLGTTIPTGQNEVAASNNWGVYGPGDCETFVARVFWVNSESKEQTEFAKPNGAAGPTTQFQVCP